MAVNKYNLGNIRDNSGQGFKSYNSYEEGAQDQMRLLGVYQNKHNLNTLNGIINRWAPTKENDTNNYVNVVSQITGIKPDQQIDLNDPVMMGKVAHAMARMEKGSNNVPLTENQYVDLASKRVANPVSQLPQRSGALTGEQLLTAKPQTEQEATQQQANPALMAPQTDQELQASTAQQLQQNRMSDEELAARERQEKQNLYASGALGLISLLGKRKGNTSEVISGKGAGTQAAYNWSAPTQQALRSLGSFGTSGY